MGESYKWCYIHAIIDLEGHRKLHQILVFIISFMTNIKEWGVLMICIINPLMSDEIKATTAGL